MKKDPTKKRPRLWKPRRPQRPSLRFTPNAWAKLLFLRDCGPTEVGGFGIAQTDDPLLVTDLQLVTQACTIASVVFDDRAVAEFFDQQVDRSLRPAQFARIWVHTHPGNSAQPSCIDEETFDRVFGPTDWAAMVILARGGQSYCRLQFHVGPGGAQVIPVRVDYSQPFDASDREAWESEFRANVEDVTIAPVPPQRSTLGALDASTCHVHDDWSARFRCDPVANHQLAQEENWYDE
jgi:proteasome lid subunit RPN8/RPN11